MKRPSFQFYPSDWRKDTALQFCSIAARGLWVEMMCIAHECEPYGHLVVNGKPMTAAQIGRLAGLGEKECRKLLDELFDAGVPSMTDDGVIYSRRMVRDEEVRERRAQGGVLGRDHGVKGKEFGKLGGNPKRKEEYNEPGKLYAIQRVSGGPIKVGITKYLSQRMNGIRKQVGEEVRLLAAVDVMNMGHAEAIVHSEFKGRIDGEWISAEWGEVETAIRGATHPRLEGRGSAAPPPPPPSPPLPPPGGPGPVRKQAVTLKAFLAECKASGLKAIPENDPVFEFADKTGIPDDWLKLAWLEFSNRHYDSQKRYRDWRKAFRNAVRGNWFRVWYMDSNGQMCLTSQGRTLQNAHKASA